MFKLMQCKIIFTQESRRSIIHQFQIWDDGSAIFLAIAVRRQFYTPVHVSQSVASQICSLTSIDCNTVGPYFRIGQLSVTVEIMRDQNVFRHKQISIILVS